ncbi:ATP-binding protein [Streptomyces sp. MST-110588]|uniref:ATP-binding protein n=1 Tax=Streptomyces sp. MST-110588 TaxID=2833628 RepID=UPI001F5CEC73|nr:ATP-binding protein [Streptomyces sp. MST-110588]
MALVVAQKVPASSIMAVPHGPAGVGSARRRLRDDLLASGIQGGVVDDAVLILSELLSNSYRHARPIYANGAPDSVRAPVPDSICGPARDSGPGAARDAAAEPVPDSVRASWRIDGQGQLTVSVTDGGGPTRPLPATPSVTARGGRGLAIIRSLAKDWGVHDSEGEVTVWAVLSVHDAFAARVDLAPAPLGGETARPTRLPNGVPRPLPNGLPGGLSPALAAELALADLEEPA